MKIAVLLAGLRFDSQRRIMNGILEKAAEDSVDVYAFTCDVWTYSTASYNQGETVIFDLPDFKAYDGVILHGDTIYDNEVTNRVVEQIKQAGVPCISLNVMYPDMLYIGMENGNGIYEITEHMIQEHKAKCIGYISGPEENTDAIGRLEGFRQALADNDFEADESYIYYGDYHPRSGEEAIRYFCRQPGGFPDTIIAANDEMAVGAFYELEKRGFQVPEEVRLSGYDNAFAGRYNYPGITSVKRPETELGRGAYQKLKKAIEGKQVKKTEDLKCVPVFAESCGCKDLSRRTPRKTEKDFRREVVKNRLHITTYSEIIKSSSADFTGVATFEQLLEQIRKYIEMIEPKEFYLCMCVVKESLEDATGVANRGMNADGNAPDVTKYAEEICIPLLYRNGWFGRYDRFTVKKLLPEEFTEEKTGKFYTVMPLHYQNRCYGYCVLGNSRLMMDSELFHLFIMNINNALENIRKQNMLNAMVQKLDRMWIYDTLTGVFNRAGFFKFAYNIIEDARSKKQDLFVLFLDLDGLKKVNDRYGHDEGDNFIKAMGKILSQVRKHGELLMRYGGDEFVVLAQNYTHEDAREYMERIETGIENYNALSSRPYMLAASMGYTIMNPAEEFDLEELIESADKEMYKVKNAKKQRMAEAEK